LKCYLFYDIFIYRNDIYLERYSILNNKKPKYPIKVLINTFNILNYFIKKGRPVALTELSEKLNIYPSTIHRILDTLRYLKYIDQISDSEKYQLGLKSLELGTAKLSQIDLIKEVMPFLNEISRKYNENVYLGVLFENMVLYLAKKETPRKIRVVTHLGARAYFNCTALGKVLMAFIPKDEREKIYKNIGFPRFTKNSITNKKQFEEEIKKVKRQGFAIDSEESEKDIQCIAIPIRDYSTHVIAALSISGPSYRFNVKKQINLKNEIIEYGQKISKSLGCKEEKLINITSN